MNEYRLQLLAITALSIAGSTFLGALGGLLVRNLPHKCNDVILGAASGVMLAAAVLGLIIPAVECETAYALILTLAGVFSGALLISVIDRVTPHLHHLVGLDTEEHVHNQGIGKTLLFVLAIAIHKIPEGLAAGVSFGTGQLNDVITVAGSISLQNVPEAMVIIAPLLTIGVSMRRTLLIALGIGLMSMGSTVVGFALVTLVQALLPFFLAFAGGTMLYVISDEMIPETHSHGFEKQATFALLAGFMLIVVLQKLLGG